MASKLYPKFKEALLGGDIDLLVDNVKVLLIDTASYTYSDSHDFLDDVPSGARMGSSANLGSKTATSGVFDAADTSITPTASGSAEALIYYKDSGTEGTSNLIFYYDGTNLPLNVNSGQAVTITFDNGSSKIFAL